LNLLANIALWQETNIGPIPQKAIAEHLFVDSIALLFKTQVPVLAVTIVMARRDVGHSKITHQA
jgi:hypothetical protein